MLAALAFAAFAETPLPPAPDRWVTDGVGVLSPEVRTSLDAGLATYERQSGHQVVVWIGDTLGGAPLDDWAVRTFEAWQVGRAGQDDGLVVFVLTGDRAIDIEVGYGLEGVVPDALAGRVIQDVMAPRLRAGDPDGAVSAGVDALVTAIEGAPTSVSGMAVAPLPETPGFTMTERIVIGVAVALFLALFIASPRLGLTLLLSATGRGMGRSGGGGRGGGGGGGGFRGGGGRSGGGGARGGW